MSPVIIKALGNYDYGIWEIVVSLLGYMGLLDIGMRPAVTRYVAKYNAQNNKEALDSLYTTTVTFNCCVGLISCSILIFWAFFNPEVISENNGDEQRYIFFLLIIGIQLLFQFPGYIAECFHMGHQRHFLKNNITLFNVIVGNTVLYFLLTNGYGLVTLALGNMLGLSLKNIVYFMLLSSRKYGNYSIRKRNFSFTILKTTVIFGGKAFIMGVAGTISGSISTLMIGFFLGPATVPFYSIPARLSTYVRGMAMTVANVFMPAFSDLHAKKENNKIRNLYIMASRYIVGSALPLIIGVAVLGHAFISRWIGQEYAEQGKIVIYYLSAGTTLLIMNPLFARLMTGAGKVGFLAGIRVLSTLILFLLSFLMVIPYGKEGVALAFTATYLVFTPYEIFYACKELKISIFYFVKRIYAPIFLPCLAISSILVAITYHYNLVNYLEIFMAAGISGVFYIVIFYFFSIPNDEKKMIKKKILSQFAGF
jgi:O-antigen/teichoic acid export membrane protein